MFTDAKLSEVVRQIEIAYHTAKPRETRKGKVKELRKQSAARGEFELDMLFLVGAKSNSSDISLHRGVVNFAYQE